MNWIIPQFSDSEVSRKTRQNDGKYIFSADLPELLRLYNEITEYSG